MKSGRKILIEHLVVTSKSTSEPSSKPMHTRPTVGALQCLGQTRWGRGHTHFGNQVITSEPSLKPMHTRLAADARSGACGKFVTRLSGRMTWGTRHKLHLYRLHSNGQHRSRHSDASSGACGKVCRNAVRPHDLQNVRGVWCSKVRQHGLGCPSMCRMQNRMVPAPLACIQG